MEINLKDCKKITFKRIFMITYQQKLLRKEVKPQEKIFILQIIYFESIIIRQLIPKFVQV